MLYKNGISCYAKGTVLRSHSQSFATSSAAFRCLKNCFSLRHSLPLVLLFVSDAAPNNGRTLRICLFLRFSASNICVQNSIGMIKNRHVAGIFLTLMHPFCYPTS